MTRSSDAIERIDPYFLRILPISSLREVRGLAESISQGVKECSQELFFGPELPRIKPYRNYVRKPCQSGLHQRKGRSLSVAPWSVDSQR